jgi:prephenate dehydratase
MRLQLGTAYDNLYNTLLPQRVNKKHLVFGIQGGKGSFNEEALQTYVKKHAIKKYKVKYLYTTEKVLRNLHEGTIDFGLFAIQNAVGGVVQESTYAMAKYRFKILEEFSIQICHFLMKRKDVSFSEIKTIMAHDQVFKQCKTTLTEKFPNFIQKVGSGDYIDHAKAAWGVAKGLLPKNIAILGPRILADIYNLDIVEENLQDSKNNLTTFFMVGRNT